MSAIGFAAVFDAVDSYRFRRIIDTKENSVSLDSESVPVYSREFLNAMTSRIIWQRIECLQNFCDDWFWDRSEILRDAIVVEKFIQKLGDAESFQLTEQRRMRDGFAAGYNRVLEIQSVFKIVKMIYNSTVFGQGQKNRLCAPFNVDDEFFGSRSHVKSIPAFVHQRKGDRDVC
jgi:hypothetical protein